MPLEIIFDIPCTFNIFSSCLAGCRAGIPHSFIGRLIYPTERNVEQTQLWTRRSIYRRKRYPFRATLLDDQAMSSQLRFLFPSRAPRTSRNSESENSRVSDLRNNTIINGQKNTRLATFESICVHCSPRGTFEKTSSRLRKILSSSLFFSVWSYTSMKSVRREKLTSLVFYHRDPKVWLFFLFHI